MFRFFLPLGLLLVLALGFGGGARAQISLDLRDVDLKTYVQLVAEKTQKNFMLDPEIEGRVTVFAPIPVSSETLYEIFLNVLEANNLAIVKGSGINRIVPIARAAGIAPGARKGGARGTFETRVIPIRRGNVTEVLEVVEPLVPNDATISAIQTANLIVLSDRAENIDRIEALVRSIAKAGGSSADAVHLRHARAADLLPVLQAVAPPPNGEALSADTGANAIVFAGPRSYRERLRDLIERLDQPQTRPISRVVRLRYAEATDLAAVIRESLGPSDADTGPLATVVAEPQSNSVLVTAPADRIDGIAAALRQLDVRPAQVLIEAVIFEISAENFANVSVQFGGLLNDALGGGTSFQLDGTVSLITLISAALTKSQPSIDPGVGGIFGYADKNFAALLTAIARERTTRLLSTPTVLALNNKDAEIIVAQNVPFVTGQYSTVGDSAVPNQPFQTIERQDVGLTLRVKPQINDGSTVRMTIEQEVSNLTGTTSAAGGEVTARRRLSTNAMVGDGQVIILGGLIEDATNISKQKVPGLARLPVLGPLFRARNSIGNKRVLLVMLRPRIMKSKHDAARISREIARKSEALGRRIATESATESGQKTHARGLPFDGIDLNQPFDEPWVDRAVRDRLFPALPPPLMVVPGN